MEFALVGNLIDFFQFERTFLSFNQERSLSGAC